MAIQKAVIVNFNIMGDGSSTNISLDLLQDAYTFGTANPVNWFSQDKHATDPSGAVIITGAQSASLSGHVVTVQFASPPGAGLFTGVSFWLLFN